MIIGCHMSVSKGFDRTVSEALEIGANTFQFFPRNPRGSRARKLKKNEDIKFKKVVEETDFSMPVCHGAYTMNLSSDKEDIRELAVRLIREDLERLEILGIDRYVFHPGSHVRQGEEDGIDYIVDGLERALEGFSNIRIGLETMSGRGTELGKNFDQLETVIRRLPYENVGICLDSCHLFASGKDVKNNQDQLLAEIQDRFGKDKIVALHLNDSMMPLGSNKDRHAKIGQGEIGAEALYELANDPFFEEIPIILETPNDMEGYAREIAFLRGEIDETSLVE